MSYMLAMNLSEQYLTKQLSEKLLFNFEIQLVSHSSFFILTRGFFNLAFEFREAAVGAALY